MSSLDYYTILGVSRGAAPDEIKKAYRRLAVHWHPDRNPGSRLAEEKFKSIAEAYAVLGNPGRRRQYDILGPSEFKNEFSHEDIFQGFEPGDFFKFFGLTDARDALDRIFNPSQAAVAGAGKQEESRARISDFFAGFGQKNSPRDPRSPDIAIPLSIALKEAAFGAEKFVAYNTPGGAVKVQVSVPPGADTGQKIVIKGRGPAKPGGQPGDIIVTLTVAPDPLFRRRGSDLLMTLELTERELADGCRSLVTALSGQSLRLNIPPGSAAGTVLKLRGYGLNRSDGTKGDLLVQLKRK